MLACDAVTFVLLQSAAMVQSANMHCLPSHPVPTSCRSPACVACGTSPAITAATLPTYDYAGFTGQAAANDAAPAPLQLIPREERITPRQLQERCVVPWCRGDAVLCFCVGYAVLDLAAQDCTGRVSC